MAGRGGNKASGQRSASSQHTPPASGSGAKRAGKWANNASGDQVNGVASRSQPIDDASSKRMHERMVFLLMNLIGAKVIATVKEGTRFEGILSATTSEGEVSVALKHARNMADADDASIKPSLLILAKDLVSVHAADLDLEKRAAAASASKAASDTFRTDTDISGPGNAGDRRLLQKWSAPSDKDAQGLEDSSAKHGQSGGAWDQFAVNERMFGSKTNYNEEFYTTKLDRTAADYKTRERKADRLAAEILAGSSSNAHILEERNAASSGKDGDEEDRYGAVIRGPNAYSPPAARAAHQSTRANGEAATSGHAANGKPASPSPVSVKQPSKILATSSALQAGSVNVESSNSLNQLMPDLKHFVQTEKEKVVAKRQAQAKKEKESKLAELANWSKSFQLKGEIPKDLMPILAKDPEKQRALQDKAKDPPANTTLVESTAGATSLSANTSIEPSRAKLTAAALSAANAAAGRSGEPALPGVGPKAPRFDKGASLSRDSIAQIPPFNALKRGLSGATSPAPSAPSPAPSATATPAVAAKLNPNVVAFVPGMSNAAPSAPPLSRKIASDDAPIASTSNNPFFGSKQIKKGSSNMQVKEEFTPFSVTSSTPVAASIPDTWGFQGKSTRDQATAILSSLPAPMPPEGAAAIMAQPPGTPQGIVPMPSQAGPPQFSVLRYPPQFVYASSQAFPGAPAAPYPAQFVGPGGFSQAAIPHQAFAPAPNQPAYLPVFRGGAQPPMFFAAGPPTPQQMSQMHSPPPGQYRRLSSASSGGQSPMQIPPQLMHVHHMQTTAPPQQP